MHVVPDPFRNRFTFQLRKHGRNIHHRPAHGGGCIKLLPYGDKFYSPLPQVVNQSGKVTDIAADTIQAIYNYCFEFMFSGSIHHLFKAWAIQISA